MSALINCHNPSRRINAVLGEALKAGSSIQKKPPHLEQHFSPKIAVKKSKKYGESAGPESFYFLRRSYQNLEPQISMHMSGTHFRRSQVGYADPWQNYLSLDVGFQS